MKTQILVEELSASEANIVESVSSDGKDCWLSGVFMQADIQNRNGRNYPLHEISTAVKNANDRIRESNGIFGELDHPQSLTINLDRISHVITEINMPPNVISSLASNSISSSTPKAEYDYPHSYYQDV